MKKPCLTESHTLIFPSHTRSGRRYQSLNLDVSLHHQRGGIVQTLGRSRPEMSARQRRKLERKFRPQGEPIIAEGAASSPEKSNNISSSAPNCTRYAILVTIPLEESMILKQKYIEKSTLGSGVGVQSFRSSITLPHNLPARELEVLPQENDETFYWAMTRAAPSKPGQRNTNKAPTVLEPIATPNPQLSQVDAVLTCPEEEITYEMTKIANIVVTAAAIPPGTTVVLSGDLSEQQRFLYSPGFWEVRQVTGFGLGASCCVVQMQESLIAEILNVKVYGGRSYDDVERADVCGLLISFEPLQPGLGQTMEDADDRVVMLMSSFSPFSEFWTYYELDPTQDVQSEEMPRDGEGPISSSIQRPAGDSHPTNDPPAKIDHFSHSGSESDRVVAASQAVGIPLERLSPASTDPIKSAYPQLSIGTIKSQHAPTSGQQPSRPPTQHPIHISNITTTEPSSSAGITGYSHSPIRITSPSPPPSLLDPEADFTSPTPSQTFSSPFLPPLSPSAGSTISEFADEELTEVAENPQNPSNNPLNSPQIREYVRRELEVVFGRYMA